MIVLNSSLYKSRRRPILLAGNVEFFAIWSGSIRAIPIERETLVEEKMSLSAQFQTAGSHKTPFIRPMYSPSTETKFSTRS